MLPVTHLTFDMMRLLLILAAVSLSLCRKEYQTHLPNGDKIPHPCKSNKIWNGVGHKRPSGGGSLNPFGEDFKAANYKWTKELCQKDSDGDKKSNGEELGDPNCSWKKGDKATKAVSHPGVCDPWYKPECSGKQQWMIEACKPEEFKCDSIKEPDVKNFTFHLNKIPVPAKETTLMCSVFNIPITDDVHMIATEAVIDNDFVMHHIVLFGCQDSAPVTENPYECGMSADPKCSEILGGWTLGMAGECMHKNIGFRLGGTKGFKKLAIQIHWNNPGLKADYTDSSGITLFYTPNHRIHDAAVLLTGTTYLEIPPKRQHVQFIGSCPAQCTKQSMKGPVFITRAFNHMHYLGISQRIEIWRDGNLKSTITNEPIFDFNSPIFYNFQDPIKVLPGDNIRTTCVFRSTNKRTTTFYGEATSDEMCFGFLTFYPAENLTLRLCSSWKSLDPCSWEPVLECPVFTKKFEESELYKNVTSRCTALRPCREECLQTVLEARKDPCMKGDAWQRIKTRVLSRKSAGQKFLGALSSCAVEVYKEENKGKPITGTSSNVNPLAWIVVMAFISAFTVQN